MALQEILYPFNKQDFSPEVVILSSGDYGQKSIMGNLIQHPLAKQKLTDFTQRIKKVKL